jgi:hypothetical protein
VLSELVHPFQCPAFNYPTPAADHGIGVKPALRGLVWGEKGDDDSWVPADVVELALIGKCGQDELIAIETGPAEGYPRSSIRIECDHVTERPGLEKIAQRLRYAHGFSSVEAARWGRYLVDGRSGPLKPNDHKVRTSRAV